MPIPLYDEPALFYDDLTITYDGEIAPAHVDNTVSVPIYWRGAGSSESYEEYRKEKKKSYISLSLFSRIKEVNGSYFPEEYENEEKNSITYNGEINEENRNILPGFQFISLDGSDHSGNTWEVSSKVLENIGYEQKENDIEINSQCIKNTEESGIEVQFIVLKPN